MSSNPGDRPTTSWDMAVVFLKLGTTAFGGPAAHIAMLQQEVVERRGWISQDEFLDHLGASNLIPGPTSTELVIHIGRKRGGWPGLVVAGTCFILPAAVMVGMIAWAYVRYGKLPAVSGLLYGVKPVVAGVFAGRSGGTAWLAEPAAITRCCCRGPGHARPGVHHGDFSWLRAARHQRRGRRYRWDLRSGVCVCRHQRAAHSEDSSFAPRWCYAGWYQRCLSGIDGRGYVGIGTFCVSGLDHSCASHFECAAAVPISSAEFSVAYRGCGDVRSVALHGEVIRVVVSGEKRPAQAAKTVPRERTTRHRKGSASGSRK